MKPCQRIESRAKGPIVYGKILRNQVGVLVNLAAQENRAEHHRTQQSPYQVAPVPPGDTGSRYTHGNAARQQDKCVDQRKDEIQVIFRRQPECKRPANIPDFKVKVRRDQVGKDQRLRGNEEDHSPPAETSPTNFMLSSGSGRLAMNYTHIFDSPNLKRRSRRRRPAAEPAAISLIQAPNR